MKSTHGGNGVVRPDQESTKEATQEIIQPNRPAVASEVGESKSMDTKELDEAANFVAEHEESGSLTPEEEKRLVRKIDAWMIPLVS